DVPLKAGNYHTWVLDPYAMPRRSEARGDVYSAIERAFDSAPINRLDVAIKRQNTDAFLRFLRESGEWLNSHD
ncbi:MAG TPA: hypothetical protein VNI20_06720, partial [Fimbriimonadaceae bacterium]|nr:hypothetical protein [Fimbriimonadaceae bacterium]